MTDTDEKIYLSPDCGNGSCDAERLWCQDDMGACEECGLACIEYVRADKLQELQSRVDCLEAAQALLLEVCDDTEEDGGFALTTKYIRHALRDRPPTTNEGKEG